MDRTSLYEKILQSLKITSKKVAKKSIENCRLLDYRQPNIPNVRIQACLLFKSFTTDLNSLIQNANASFYLKYRETFANIMSVLK